MNNITKSITELTDFLMSKYHADVTISFYKKSDDSVFYNITMNPWGTGLYSSFVMTDDEIRNTCIDDIISVGMDTAMEKIMAKTEEMK